MPAIITTLASLIPGILSAAPQIEAAVTATKNFIGGLFGAGVISAAQQNALNAHVDAVIVAFTSGQTPPEFEVEADPAK